MNEKNFEPRYVSERKVSTSEGNARATDWEADRAEPLRCVFPMWQG